MSSLHSHKSLTILWFRNDLRVHDNQLLAYSEISDPSSDVVALYCIDPRYHLEKSDICDSDNNSSSHNSPFKFEKRWHDLNESEAHFLSDAYGFDSGRCSPQRSYFLAESLLELQYSLRTKFGIKLKIIRARPDEAVVDLCEQYFCFENIIDDRVRSCESTNTYGVVNLCFQGAEETEEIEIEKGVVSSLDALPGTSSNNTNNSIISDFEKNIHIHYNFPLYHRDDIKAKMGYDIVTEYLPWPFGEWFHKLCKSVDIRKELELNSLDEGFDEECLFVGGGREDFSARIERVEKVFQKSKHSTANRISGKSEVKTLEDILLLMNRKFTGNRQKDIEHFLNLPENLPTTIDNSSIDLPNSIFTHKGGESQALDRLWYFVNVNGLWHYNATRNQLHGLERDMSSLLSPWLANGCLSPRRVYWMITEIEEKFANVLKVDKVRSGKNTDQFDHVGKFWFQMTWRDYFRYYFAFFKEKAFHLGGPSRIDLNYVNDDGRMSWLNFLRNDSTGSKIKVQKNDSIVNENSTISKKDLKNAFKSWIFGQTSQPLVDAAMRQLLLTGYISNRARYIVASFLTHYLGIDWRLGAKYFEFILLDHDVCINYGEWSSLAGVCRHPKLVRDTFGNKVTAASERSGKPWSDVVKDDKVNAIAFFDPVQQAEQYDRNGTYVKKWRDRGDCDKKNTSSDKSVVNNSISSSNVSQLIGKRGLDVSEINEKPFEAFKHLGNIKKVLSAERPND